MLQLMDPDVQYNGEDKTKAELIDAIKEGGDATRFPVTLFEDWCGEFDLDSSVLQNFSEADE